LADAPGLVLVTTIRQPEGVGETDTRFRNAGMEYDLQKCGRLSA